MRISATIAFDWSHGSHWLQTQAMLANMETWMQTWRHVVVHADIYVHASYQRQIWRHAGYHGDRGRDKLGDRTVMEGHVISI